MSKLKFFLIFCITGFLKVSAQDDLTFYKMEDVFQSSYINPSVTPHYKVSIGLPVISSTGFYVASTGFTYGDFYIRDENGRVIGSPESALRKLKDRNYFFGGAETDLFHLRVKVRSMSFALFSQVVAKTRVSYSDDFMDLLIRGNADKIGRDLNYENTGLDYEMYRTVGLGITKQFKRLTVGANLKYLNGISNVSIDPGKNLKLRFDEGFYDLHVNSDVTVRTAGLEERTSSSDENDYKTKAPSNPGFSDNPGFAFDLGLNYQIHPRLNISASALNLGSINWNRNAVNRNISVGLDFAGFDVFGDFIRGGGVTDSSLQAEFEDSVKYKITNESYRRRLSPQFYLSADYKVSPKTTIGILAGFEKYYKWRSSASLSIRYQLSRTFSIVGTYNLQYKKYDNIGLGAVLKLGPFQIYAAGDNILIPLAKIAGEGFEITKNTVDPLNNFNFRMGINLIFGKVHGPATQSYKNN